MSVQDVCLQPQGDYLVARVTVETIGFAPASRGRTAMTRRSRLRECQP